jgi:hypothetical protein
VCVCVYRSAACDGCGFDDVVARSWLVSGRGVSLVTASRKVQGLSFEKEVFCFLGGVLGVARM